MKCKRQKRVYMFFGTSAQDITLFLYSSCWITNFMVLRLLTSESVGRKTGIVSIKSIANRNARKVSHCESNQRYKQEQRNLTLPDVPRKRSRYYTRSRPKQTSANFDRRGLHPNYSVYEGPRINTRFHEVIHFTSQLAPGH